ncbi:hypothetical protein JKF63_03524 [Porcisia hertigi]|uniref:Uncharacterized protein n=1 Tax=Porcisia hertigi TaxID=2761500 RepID=A0A836HWP1_9TRYP|nr:hypothetical protein JKF63_03524 [Porcisia hertigi]
MDRHVLLSSSHHDSPPLPLQSFSSSPQQPSGLLGTSQVIPKGRDNGTHATASVSGTGGDARCSFFNIFSSVWSETATSRGSTNRSLLTAAFLRPFQCLRLWCRGSGGCCGFCCSWITGSRVGMDDDGDNFGITDVYADVPQHSGASHSSRYNIDARDTTPPPTTPNAGSGRGHARRQYAPPRWRSSKAGSGGGISADVTLATERAGRAGDESPVRRSDSFDESSRALSSTSPCSLPNTQQSHVQGKCEGEHLVMQRGVLMRMAADGTCTRVAEAPAYASGFRNPTPSAHLSSRTSDGRTLQSGEQEPFTDASGHTGSTPTPITVDNVSSPYAVAMVLKTLEESRQPLCTLNGISDALAMCAPYLPLRVEVETDLNSAAPSIAGVVEAAPAETDSASLAATTASALRTVPLNLHVLGPLLPCPTTQALQTLEDILLEDRDRNLLPLCALHCADLDLRGVKGGEDDDADRQPIAALAARPQSNAFLDLLVSQASDAHSISTAVLSHVLTFLKHLVTARSTQFTTLHFTRCYVAPHDVGRSIPLPLAAVRRLRFEHCSLTPAHVDALLVLARQQDALALSRLVETRGVNCLQVRSIRSFGVLEELQLSGSLTLECITELLDFVEEQQQCGGGRGGVQPVALQQLCLPLSVVRAAKAHPFIQANRIRISVVTGHV